MFNGVIDNSENRKKTVKCDNCKKETNRYTTMFFIDKHYNELLQYDVYEVSLYYKTICKNCGDLIYGVMRKELSIKDIEKIFGV